MYKIIWTHHKDCSNGYLLSDVSYIDNKGRYVFDSPFVSATNENRIDGYVRTVISPKSVITTITDTNGEIKEKHVKRVLSLSFE